MLDCIQSICATIASRLRYLKGEASSVKYYPHELPTEITQLTSLSKGYVSLEEYITGEGGDRPKIIITNATHVPKIPFLKGESTFDETMIVAPEARTAEFVGSGYFYGPKVTYIDDDILREGMVTDTIKARYLYLPKVQSLPKGIFYSPTNLKYMEIGTESNTVCSFYGSGNYYFEGDHIEKIYVPDNLIDNYKMATGWSERADKIYGISTKPSIPTQNL